MSNSLLLQNTTQDVILDAYFERIGYTGEKTNTLAVLNALHIAHVRAIPFENLDILLGKFIDTDMPAIFEKLVTNGRGGYCFETNALFADVLTRLGFQIDFLRGRVWYGLDYPAQSADLVPPQSHQLTLVRFENGEQWIADVGFGGMGPVVPLAFNLSQEQSFGPDYFRILPAAPFGYMLQYRDNTDWINLYSFELTPCFPADYELGNYYICRSPKTWFTQIPVCARPHAEGRLSLRGDEFKQTDIEGNTSTKKIKTVEAYQEILQDFFSLQFSFEDASRLIEPLIKKSQMD